MNAEISVETGDWKGLLSSLVANMQLNAMPKKPKAEDWFMLRERWNNYSDSHRKYYLAAALGQYIISRQTAGEELDLNVIEKFRTTDRLEEFSSTEKKAIAKAIMDAERYSKVDQALIYKKRALKTRLNSPD